MDLSPERCTARADGTLGGISLSTFSSAHLDLWKGTVVVKHKEARVTVESGGPSLDQKQFRFGDVSARISHFLIFASESPRRKRR